MVWDDVYTDPLIQIIVSLICVAPKADTNSAVKAKDDVSKDHQSQAIP